MKSLVASMLFAQMLAQTAHADTCPKVTVSMLPSNDLQIVAWIEDRNGNYVDTIFITQSTGLYGIGNRPAVFGVKSGPRWPYGKRLDVFPVWAHRHGFEFPEIIFQGPHEDEEPGINAPYNFSTRESHFCRPLRVDEEMWDSGTCATSAIFTDKGKPSGNVSSYPPRSDLARKSGDDELVETFADMNPFDTISQATPLGGAPFAFTARVAQLHDADYVLRVEVSKEFDKNATYNDQTFPTPVYPYGEYGMPYRGQPSVVYEVPFSTVGSVASTATYAGYGDPDGIDGLLRAPDDTIETGPGSGAGRLMLASDAEPYRLRVEYERGIEVPPPSAIAEPRAKVDDDSAIITFAAAIGEVDRYDIRYRAGEVSEGDFDQAKRWPGEPTVRNGVGTFLLDGLAPRTAYTVGIRAFTECGTPGPLVTFSFETERASGEVTITGCCNANGLGNVPIALALLMLVTGRSACTRRRRGSRCHDRSPPPT